MEPAGIGGVGALGMHSFWPICRLPQLTLGLAAVSTSSVMLFAVAMALQVSPAATV